MILAAQEGPLTRVLFVLVALLVVQFAFSYGLALLVATCNLFFRDLERLIESWGRDDPPIDIGPAPWGDGTVEAADLEVAVYGAAPGDGGGQGYG